MEPRTVIMYGQSMLMSLVSESLMRMPNLEVFHLSNWEQVASLPSDCCPDVLIYDLAAASDSQILMLLFKNPHLLLIGLDVETNRAVLLVGKETRYLTLERLKELLLKE